MGLMPEYEQPPLDPRYDALMEKTKQQDILAIQDTLKMDTASIMARYGAMLQASGGGITTAPAVGGMSAGGRARGRGATYG